MNGRSLQVQEWISMQIENIQGMLLQSLGAHLCAPGCLCLCSSALKSCGKGISASPHVVSVTSGFSMWFHVETHPLGFCGSALKWKIQMVLAHGTGDAESMGGSVQCFHCFPVSRNLPSCLSLEATAILQSLECVHPRERDDLEFSAFGCGFIPGFLCTG